MAKSVANDESRKIIPFASGHSRTQWVSVLLAVIVVLDIVAIISDYMQIQLVNRALAGETITIAEATASDSRQAAIGGIYLVLFIITAILFLMWIHRAHRNLPSLGAKGLQYSPRWAVGGFFVPFLNLVRPFQVTTEIWKASDSTTDIADSVAWRSAPTSPIIISWWVLFLVSGVLGQILWRLSLQVETLDELLTTSWLTFVTDVVDIPAAILAIMIIRNIDHRQEKKNQLLASYVAT